MTPILHKGIEPSHDLANEFLSRQHNKTSAKVSKEAKLLDGNINSETAKWSLPYIMALDSVYHTYGT